MVEAFDPKAPPEAKPPVLLRPWGGALLVACLAIVSHGWMTTLELQLDDYEQIAQAARPFEPAVLLGMDTASMQAERGHPTMVRFFRPLLHVSFALDVALFGAGPMPLHAVSVFWHVLNSLLLFFTVRKALAWRTPETALLAGAVFALHPGKMGAVAWVAARGDLLMTTAFLVSLLFLVRFRRRGGKGSALGVVVALLAGLAAKEAAAVLPVLLFAVDLLLVRRYAGDSGVRPALRFAIPYALLAPAALIGRAVAFGSDAGLYAGEVRTFSFAILGRMLADFLPATRGLVGGSFRHIDEGFGALVQGLAGTALLIGLGIWVARRPIVRLRGLAALLIAYAVALFPSLRFFREASGFDASRLFYLPAVFIAVLMALPLGGLFVRVGLVRRATMLLAVVFGVSLALATWREFGAYRDAADVVARVRQDLRAMTAMEEGRGRGYMILDLPNDCDGAPCYGTFLTVAMRPPFVDRPILAKSVIDLGVVLGNGELHAVGAAFPVQILRWNATERRLEPVGGLLPAKKGFAPRVVFAPGETALALAPPIHPRDVRAVEVVFESAPSRPSGYKIRFDDDRGATAEFAVLLDPRFGSTAAQKLRLYADGDWTFRGPIVAVSVRADSADGPRVAALDFAADLERLEASSPPEGARLALAGPEPEFVASVPETYPFVRLSISVSPVVLTWTMARADVLSADGRVRIKPSMQGLGAGEKPRYFSDLTSGGNKLDERGVATGSFAWRIEGIRGDPSWPQASTAERRAVLER